MKKLIPYLIGAIVIVIIIFQFLKIRELKSIPPPIPTIDTILIKKDTTIYKPGKTIYKDTTIYDKDTLYKDVDTMAILRDYFAKNVYIDTLEFADSLGFVSITDTITKNSIKGRVWNASITQKIIKETKVITIPKNTEVYFGGGLSGNTKDFINCADVGLLLKTKKDRIYGADVGLIKQPEQKVKIYFGGRAYFKIDLKKKK